MFLNGWPRTVVSAGVLLFSAVLDAGVVPEGTAFTYQGQLRESGAATEGVYDVRFRLYDEVTGGTQRGSQIVVPNIAITDGLFTVELDFGPEFVGAARWLEVDVRPDGTGPYTTLSPRQPLHPAPSSQFSLMTEAVDWSGVLNKPAGFADGVDDGAFSLNLSNEAFFSGGNVGIGTTDPDDLFEIVGSLGGSFRVRDIGPNPGTGNQLISQFVSDVGGVTLRLIGVGEMGQTIGSTVALEQTGALSLGNQFPAQVTIGFDGNVGVGTTDPAAAMHIQDGALWLSGNGGGNLPVGAGSGLRLWNEGSLGLPVIAGYDYDMLQPVDLLLQPDGGRVGIRSLDPDALLSIENVGSADGVPMLGFGEGPSLSFWFSSGFTPVDGENFISLATNIGGLGSIMTWKGNGRVGIGTTAPTARLDVRSFSANSTAIHAENTGSGASVGVHGKVNSGYGVYGEATGSGNPNYGVFGASGSSPAAYGVFAAGRIGASGTKTFMIDHPADPEEKYLLHYSLESPEPQNVYNGVVQLNADGEAAVRLPDYFELINADFRYQLTAIGGPAPLLHIASEIEHGVFTIAGGMPGMKVSWEVKARRNDRFVQQMGAPVEMHKGPAERGLYLMPQLYGQPESKRIHNHPATTETVDE